MTNGKKILKLIEQAAKEGRTEVDPSENRLTSLPPEITSPRVSKGACQNHQR